MISSINDKIINNINQLTKDYNIENLSHPFNKYYYISDNNDIIGYIDYAIIYDKSELNYIFIRKEYRNKGYAQKLFNFMINDVIKNNCENISLEVNVNNVSAINFYKKNKFQIVTKREKYYKNADGYLMVRVVKK